MSQISTTMRSKGSDGKPRNFLLVLQEDGNFITHSLPDSGEVIIGRSERCDVTIQHPSISRQHAVLKLTDPVSVADLGSSNGTRVRETRLSEDAPVELSTNELFSVGEVTLVLQRRAAPIRSRRIWGHDYFEGRVHEECTRCARDGTFAVLRLSFATDIDPSDVQQPLGEVLRDVDVLGQYGPRDFEVLLVDAQESDLELVEKRVDLAFSARSRKLAVGRALFPRDGRAVDKLLATARPSRSDLVVGGTDRGVVLEDEAMRNLYALAERVARGTINVLILGETGVGKQVLAEAIHKKSPRQEEPFLELNCSAFSESLLESELFGHEKGAFTGAQSSKVGLLESANGGTVFLDEIGDMALPLQAKLLRALENSEVLPVGGLKPRSIDVRFVSATNRDLEQEVLAGRFRQDLFFRINGVTLQVPPLRERQVEIEALAASFVAEYSHQMGRSEPLGISPQALELLRGYSWPGNIRELRNVIERATLLTATDVIGPEHLPVDKMNATFSTPSPTAHATMFTMPSSDDWGEGTETQPAVQALTGKESQDEKKQRIMEALMACGGNNTEAAKLLGVSRRTLGKWLEALGIPRPRKQRRTEPVLPKDE